MATHYQVMDGITYKVVDGVVVGSSEDDYWAEVRAREQIEAAQEAADEMGVDE